MGIDLKGIADITVIILTRNEEENISECINSVKRFVKRIVVVDSFSEDNTVELAREQGAEVYQHEFVNHAQQFMYAEQKADIRTAWIFRIDADERITEEAADEIVYLCRNNLNTDVNGIRVRYCNYFMGKALRHGGVYPWYKLCIYKTGKGGIENRSMDEHIVLYEGRYVNMKTDSIHLAFRGLTFFINKFNWYSTKEALAYFENDTAENQEKMDVMTEIKHRVYYKLPMGFRSWIFYLFRYYIRLGFLDGPEGKIYAFFHAYWYRFLVDAKIYEFCKTGKCENPGALK